MMLRGINRQDIFDDTEDYWTFIKMMSAVPCYIYAYCLMPRRDQRDRSLIFFHKNLRITLFICIFAVFCRIFKFIYPELA